MASYIGFYTYGGKDGLTKHERFGSYGSVEAAYEDLLKNAVEFAREREANGIDAYVKLRGQRVSLDNPALMRELLAKYPLKMRA